MITLQHVSDDRGELYVAEIGSQLPFDVKRIYFLTGVPAHESRGGHAHKQLRQVFIAVAGGFTITLTDGKATEVLRLEDAGVGLVVSEMIWRELSDFTPNAVCMVLASEPYSESDYYRTYTAFTTAVDARSP